MTSILYIDTASNCIPPQAKGEKWQPHMIRVAAIREDDGVETSLLAALILPPVGVTLSPATEPYHKASSHYFVAHGKTIEDVAMRLAGMLDGIEIVVAHHMAFHRKVLAAGMEAGGSSFDVARPTYDTMGGTADIVRVRQMRNGQWKPPSLPEAYAHFAGKPMPSYQFWRDHAVQQVEAVRLIYTKSRETAHVR